ncbi:hypothetical protein BDV95DRAFT_486706 [Massariosphaeria phaeospora]|uniref:Pentatricopeptide repeat protein n=1 Tax=Massariosphaeria phaeospora TaxID=100035 RepID=A0A7C8MU28_9PLEO|nr:hypothetical protein BDV95DRAFT_486706 [Massariosphaeria phaeospora]
MFFNRKEDRALEEWEQDHREPGFDARHDYEPKHLELGVRMHALRGNADRARAIMKELFELYPSWDTAIMMTVFRALTSTQEAQHHNTARDIYVNMKGLLGNKATLAEYDSWLIGFLEARHLRYARQVFQDMVRDGILAATLSPKDVHEVLQRLHLLYRLGTDIEKMTSIALQAIDVLPQSYHSHLFGHWIKSAVVEKAPTAAAQILEMMFKRGYKPETYHFNLLLGSLLRTNDRVHQLKVENLGWRMVDLEQSSADRRKAPGITETVYDLDAAQKVPPADVTTFALLMRHHASQFQWEYVDYLTRTIREADIQPNQTVLEVLVDNHCRQGKYKKAWEVYTLIVNPPEGIPGVFPGGATMRRLWITLRLALGDHELRNDKDLPSPRQLLAETLHWWTLCRSRHDSERFRMGLAAADHGAITSLMMHCFSYTGDLPGSLVALHILRKKFGIFPGEQAVRILQRQTAWVDMHRATTSAKAQYYHSKTNKNNIEKMGQVCHILMQKRFERMKITGEQFADMTQEQAGDIGLNLISEFVRVILKRQNSPEMVEAMIDEAKMECGVPNLATGDLDTSEVA